MREVTVLTVFVATLFVAIVFVAVEADPSGPVYDQRQEGSTNVHAQLENVVVLVVPPAGMGLLDLVELASKSVGGGRHEAPSPSSAYRPPALERHHTPTHVTPPHSPPLTHQSQDAKLQRDPDYEQVKKHFSNLPNLPSVSFDDTIQAQSAPIQGQSAPIQGQSAPIQESPTTSPNDVVSSSSSTKPSTSDDATPLFIKDAVNAHSPKLALYSQFRSAVQPSHHKKHNRANR